MDIQVLATISSFVVGVITIIASMYGMLKFMLKDIHKEVEILKEGQQEFKLELKHIHKRIDLLSMRSDGLYQVLLDRTYGTNIPSGMK